MVEIVNEDSLMIFALTMKIAWLIVPYFVIMILSFLIDEVELKGGGGGGRGGGGGGGRSGGGGGHSGGLSSGGPTRGPISPAMAFTAGSSQGHYSHGGNKAEDKKKKDDEKKKKDEENKKKDEENKKKDEEEQKLDANS